MRKISSLLLSLAIIHSAGCEDEANPDGGNDDGADQGQRTDEELLVASLTPAYRTYMTENGDIPGDITIEHMAALRQAFIRALVPALPQGFRPVAGTMLDSAATDKPTMNAFSSQLLPVLNVHINLLLHAKQLDTAEPEDEAEFAQWSESGALDDLLSRATSDEQRADIEFFANLTASQRFNVLLGQPADGTPVPIGNTFDAVADFADKANYEQTDPCPSSGSLAGRCAALDQTIARLASVQSAAGGTSLETLIPATQRAIGGNKIMLLFLQRDINGRETTIKSEIKGLAGCCIERARGGK